MTLASELISETRRHLFSGQQEEMNRLDGSITDSATTITFKYDLGGIQKGALIAIDLEEIRIWEASGKTASVVERGVNSSTAATHADLATVVVKPKFSDFRIFQSINNDLRDLSSPQHGLFQVKTVELTFNSQFRGYDMTAVASDLLTVLEIRYETSSNTRSFPKIDSFRLARNMNTDDFASGTALILNEGADSGRPIRVRYAAPFDLLTSASDVVETVSGLTASMIDLPPLGAAIRLVAPRDVKRSFSEHQGEPRRADEVPVGSGANSMRGLLAVRQQRITAEVARLTQQWPKALVY